MKALYAVHCERGDIKFKIFKDWLPMHDSYSWIDAQLSFTTRDSQSIVEVVYSSLYIHNTSYIDKLKSVQSMGHYLETIWDANSTRKSQLNARKKPHYAKHAYWIIPTHQSSSDLIEMSQFGYVESETYKPFAALHRNVYIAADNIIKSTMTWLGDHLRQIPKRLSILKQIRLWIFSLNWSDAENEHRKAFKFFKNNRGDYIWLHLRFINIKSGNSCCFGMYLRNELEINMGCYQLQPCNHYAQQIVEKLERMQRSNDIMDILQIIQQQHDQSMPIFNVEDRLVSNQKRGSSNRSWSQFYII